VTESKHTIGSVAQDAERDAKRRLEGRYTPKEAAKLLAEFANGGGWSVWLDKLVKAMESNTLDAYLLDRNGTTRPQSKMQAWLAVDVFSSDLNEWLAANETHVEWRFPEPAPRLTKAPAEPMPEAAPAMAVESASHEPAPLTTAPATNPEKPAPVVAASDDPVKRRAKKPTIETVAIDYMREVYKNGQFQSAAMFHKHLITTAGATDSPFEMGIGKNAGKLFCPAASSFYDCGTLGKIWAKIRAV